MLLGAGDRRRAVATAAKWLLVGRFRVADRPLWTSFVWRNELADTFVEVLAAPWLVRFASGTPAADRVAADARREDRPRRVAARRYWLPESDLVRLGDGATVNRGCVVQTHLFHDRIMSMDEVTLGAGATLGPHGIVLPGASIGARTTVGPGSLVTRGDAVPADTRWLGNPIATWPAPAARRIEVRRSAPPGADRSTDPYLPEHGNGGYRVLHYDLDLDYRVATEPARRPGGRSPRWPSRRCPRFSLDLGRVPGRRTCGWTAGRRGTPTGRTSCGSGPSGRSPPAPRSRSRSGTPGRPRPISRPVGRHRLGRADRRRARGQPADRGAVLVPVQRPARRQGHATG